MQGNIFFFECVPKNAPKYKAFNSHIGGVGEAVGVLVSRARLNRVHMRL